MQLDRRKRAILDDDGVRAKFGVDPGVDPRLPRARRRLRRRLPRPARLGREVRGRRARALRAPRGRAGRGGSLGREGPGREQARRDPRRAARRGPALPDARDPRRRGPRRREAGRLALAGADRRLSRGRGVSGRRRPCSSGWRASRARGGGNELPRPPALAPRVPPRGRPRRRRHARRGGAPALAASPATRTGRLRSTSSTSTASGCSPPACGRSPCVRRCAVASAPTSRSWAEASRACPPPTISRGVFPASASCCSRARAAATARAVATAASRTPGMPGLGWVYDARGPEAARAYYDATLLGLAQIRAFVQEHGVDCDLEENGSLELATEESAARRAGGAEAPLRRARDRGDAARRPRELRRAVSAPSASSAPCRLAGPAILNPAKLALGMRRTIESLGVVVSERSKVLRFEPGSDRAPHDRVRGGRGAAGRAHPERLRAADRRARATASSRSATTWSPPSRSRRRSGSRSAGRAARASRTRACSSCTCGPAPTAASCSAARARRTSTAARRAAGTTGPRSRS